MRRGQRGDRVTGMRNVGVVKCGDGDAVAQGRRRDVRSLGRRDCERTNARPCAAPRTTAVARGDRRGGHATHGEPLRAKRRTLLVTAMYVGTSRVEGRRAAATSPPAKGRTTEAQSPLVDKRTVIAASTPPSTDGHALAIPNLDSDRCFFRLRVLPLKGVRPWLRLL